MSRLADRLAAVTPAAIMLELTDPLRLPKPPAAHHAKRAAAVRHKPDADLSDTKIRRQKQRQDRYNRKILRTQKNPATAARLHAAGFPVRPLLSHRQK
jgi:hypothetical protein